MENLEKDYKKGKEVLEDLRFLGDSSLAPLISRAHHHLFEIRRKAEDNLSDPSLYSNVNELLNNHVENMIHLYFKKMKDSQQSVSIWIQETGPSLIGINL